MYVGLDREPWRKLGSVGGLYRYFGGGSALGSSKTVGCKGGLDGDTELVRVASGDPAAKLHASASEGVEHIE